MQRKAGGAQAPTADSTRPWGGLGACTPLQPLPFLHIDGGRGLGLGRLNFNLKCRAERWARVCRTYSPGPWGGLGSALALSAPPPSSFLRSGLRGQRPPHSACPVLPRPFRAGCAAQAAAPQWGRAGRAGRRSARRPAPRPAPPPQCAAAAAESGLNPFRAGAEQAGRSRSAAASLRVAAGQLFNSFPPRARKERWAPAAERGCRVWTALGLV